MFYKILVDGKQCMIWIQCETQRNPSSAIENFSCCDAKSRAPLRTLTCGVPEDQLRVIISSSDIEGWTHHVTWLHWSRVSLVSSA